MRLSYLHAKEKEVLESTKGIRLLKVMRQGDYTYSYMVILIHYTTLLRIQVLYIRAENICIYQRIME